MKGIVCALVALGVALAGMVFFAQVALWPPAQADATPSTGSGHAAEPAEVYASRVQAEAQARKLRELGEALGQVKALGEEVSALRTEVEVLRGQLETVALREPTIVQPIVERIVEKVKVAPIVFRPEARPEVQKMMLVTPAEDVDGTKINPPADVLKAKPWLAIDYDPATKTRATRLATEAEIPKD